MGMRRGLVMTSFITGAPNKNLLNVDIWNIARSWVFTRVENCRTRFGVSSDPSIRDAEGKELSEHGESMLK